MVSLVEIQHILCEIRVTVNMMSHDQYLHRLAFTYLCTYFDAYVFLNVGDLDFIGRSFVNKWVLNNKYSCYIRPYSSQDPSLHRPAI